MDVHYENENENEPPSPVGGTSVSAKQRKKRLLAIFDDVITTI